MYKFADTLKELIFESGKSLRTIESESGIPSSQLSRYLKTTIPKLEISLKLANYFNCSLDYLFGLSDTKGKFYAKYDITKFVPRYLKLLEDNGTTHWKFSHENNFSESCIRQWKNGQIPKMETIVIIAENIGASIDYLIGK